MKYGLEDSTIEKINSVFYRYPQVEKAILYGSRAKGNYKKGSDIDLTLVGKTDLISPALNQIIEDLDDLLIPYSFDLSIFSELSETHLLDHIKRVGITFYERARPLRLV